MRRALSGLLALACVGLASCANNGPWFGEVKDVTVWRHAVSQPPFQVRLLARAHDRVLHDMIDAAAFSPDGKYIAIGSMHSFHLVIWDIENQRTVRQIPLPSGTEPDSLLWSADGRFLATYKGGAVLVFEPFSGELLQKFVGKEIGSGGPLYLRLNETESELAVVFFDAKDVGPSLAVFDTASWQFITFETRKKLNLRNAFWAKDKIVALGSDRTRERFLSQLDPATGEISGRLVITRPINPDYDRSPSIELKAMCTNADGTRMAITYQHPQEIDSTLKIVNLQTLTLEKSMPMSSDDVLNSCVYSPDGRHLFLQNAFGPIRIVDTQNYQQIGSIPHKVSNGGLAISRDGKRLAIGQETELLIYRIDPPASHD